jgi:PEP-CTERM motif
MKASRLGALFASSAAFGAGMLLSGRADATPLVQITDGFMMLSYGNPPGAWALAGDNFAAVGGFHDYIDISPQSYVLMQVPYVDGTLLSVGWRSDTEDGLTGQMSYDGVPYNLDGTILAASQLAMTVPSVQVNGPGVYNSTFTFSALMCGFVSQPASQCAQTVDLTGQGTVSFITTDNPIYQPAAFEIQSITYTFTSVPEPAGLALFAAGLLGLAWSQRRKLVRMAR